MLFAGILLKFNDVKCYRPISYNVEPWSLEREIAMVEQITTRRNLYGCHQSKLSCIRKYVVAGRAATYVTITMLLYIFFRSTEAHKGLILVDTVKC